MHKILIAPDSFKGTMSSETVCARVARAALTVWPEAEAVRIPVADGGEGSVDCLLAACGGTRIEAASVDPFAEPMTAFYGLLPDGTAVVEMAACAGLPLAGDRKNPEVTTTCGVGTLLLHAARHGAKRALVCLGGSATNDGGCGMAAACGVRFYDADGHAFVPVGGTLGKVVSIDASGFLLPGFEVEAMCDIDNPLCGETGAAYVFAPQKGADAAMVARLDCGLRHIAGILRRDLGVDVIDLPGAGAAGGMGGGLAAFFGARLRRGIEAVLDAAGFDRLLDGAELVVTGEGRFDAQSLRGKVVSGVARRCAAAGVPCVALVGDIGDSEPCLPPFVDCQGNTMDFLPSAKPDVLPPGLTAVFSINRVAAPYETLRSRAPEDLEATAAEVFRLLRRFGV